MNHGLNKEKKHMGRAINMENDIDSLKHKVKTIEEALEEVLVVIEDIMDSVDNKEKKNVKKKTDNKRNSKSSKQSDSGDSKSTEKND